MYSERQRIGTAGNDAEWFEATLQKAFVIRQWLLTLKNYIDYQISVMIMVIFWPKWFQWMRETL